MRAAVYCRISQDKTGEGLGVTRQQEDCVALAEQLGWTVTEVYADNDISATSGKTRPGYRRMLRAIAAGEVQAVIAWHPDRLYRRLVDLEELIPVVETHGVAIRTCRAGDFDLATPTGRMIARILASVATGEVEVKADRWKRSVRQRREAGRWSNGGTRMFGWDREGELIPEEASVIRWLADEVIAGRTLTSLCRDLNARGVRTTRGNGWQPAPVRGLLVNPRLAGWASLNGEIVGQGDWEPALDPETWETVRAVLVARRSGPRKPRVSLLLGMLYCGSCGARLIAGGREGGRRTYRCRTIVGREATACGAISVSASTIEELVEGFARARFADPRLRDRIAQLQAVDGSGAAAHEAVSLEDRIRELEEQLDEPGIPVAAIVRAIDRAKVRLEEYRATLAHAADVQIMPAVDGEWPEDFERRRRLIGVFVERVEVQPATVTGVFDPDRIRVVPRF